ncbi:MAG: N-formylglutamate amidohydrolase [Woeseiaceae bacterium]
MADDSTGLAAAPALLAADEPAAFTVLNAGSDRLVLLVCDHASRRFPRALGDLGLDPAARRSHLAFDIGAGRLTRRLASRLEATAVLAGYSRLIIDCNRDLLDSDAFLECGDGVDVPGNRNLTEAQKTARVENIYWPYHRAIEEQIRRLAAPDRLPAVISIHSFTPVLNGVSRPWEIGVLWDADKRIAGPAMQGLREAGFVVGDNQPYSGKAPQDFTVDRHAETAGLAHVGFEVRQDLVDNAAGVKRVAAILERTIERLPPSVFSAGNSIVGGNAQAHSPGRHKEPQGQRS